MSINEFQGSPQSKPQSLPNNKQIASSMAAFRSISFFLIFNFLVIGGTAYNHMLPGDTLESGESLEEANYKLTMHPDCELVLFEQNSQKVTWSSLTKNHGNGCVATLRTDGNFVIDDRNGTMVAQTATNKTNGNYVFLLQRDGNIALYTQPTWGSGTNLYDQPASTPPNNQAIKLGNKGRLSGLMIGILVLLCWIY